MRNIQVLPTDKPSRLYEFGGNYHLQEIPQENFRGHNIYITSDEEIKKGNWYLEEKSKFNPRKLISEEWGDGQHFKTFNQKGFRKIILTTDTDLIADGVQAIDDSFLEWFVNNPSCEWAEVQKWSSLAECGYSYHIIIPKEEPKKIYYNTVGRENGVNVVKGQFNTQKEALDLANELNRKFPDLYYDWRETLIKEEPKQETLTYTESAKKEERIFNYRMMKQAHENAKPAKETLEEAAEKYIETSHYMNNDRKDDIIFGAKWQAERMYSEKEVEGIIASLLHTPKLVEESSWEGIAKWFEQFKKK